MNADLILGDPSISILEGVVLPWGEPSGYLRKVVLPTLARAFKFDPNKFVVEGKAWDVPANPDDPMNQALNRRVEISVYPPEAK